MGLVGGTGQERVATPAGRSVGVTLAELLEAVKFEHSVFALPFAYLGMVLAARGLPAPWQVVWITVAMVAARTLAMATNRLIDRELDARNPRTRSRALPAGRLSVRAVVALALGSAAVFFGAAALLNPLCLALSPLAAVIVVGYAYTKRFTWLSHFILGIADGIAPMGGWLAVTGSFAASPPAGPFLLALAVATWIAGFDLIYSCQDVEFDRREGLHAIPARFGIAAALRVSVWVHVLTAALLLALGLLMPLGWPFYAGWLAAVGLLVYEHRLVRPDDLSRVDVAFFNVNGYIAIIVFVATFVATMVAI
ncbi:MAG: UbiA family prenyltransferase [Chloroflexi bacterium]|nr:UbiA family prenyltransferase [Chloroflexota bacterium]